MDKFINFSRFLGYFFDEGKRVQQAARIVKGLMEARSPRLSNIAEKMPGTDDCPVLTHLCDRGLVR
jgi:hypothetical protein